MKKVMLSVLLTIIAGFVLFASTGAASAEAEMKKVTKNSRPYEGEFNGKVYGDKGTSAPLSMNLTHQGNEVKGNLFLGEGLFIDGGMCGKGYVPAGSQFAVGRTSSSNPNQLTASSTFKVNGVNVKVLLNGDVSADGETLKAKARIDLPWICGHDPIISGTLYRS